MVDVLRNGAVGCASKGRFDVVSCQFAVHYAALGRGEEGVADSLLSRVPVKHERTVALAMTLPDWDTVLQSPHVVQHSVTHGGMRYVYHWPPFVQRSLEQRVRVDKLMSCLKSIDPRWSLAFDVRFDGLPLGDPVPDDRYYRAVVVTRAGRS